MRKYFNLSVFGFQNIDFQTLFSADFVILHDFNTLPEWYSASRFQGQVVLVPGDELNLTQVGQSLGVGLQVQKDSSRSPLATASLNNPLFASLFDKRSSRVTLPQVSVPYKIGAFTNLYFEHRKGQTIWCAFKTSETLSCS